MKRKVNIVLVVCVSLAAVAAYALFLFFKASADMSPVRPAGALRIAVSEFLIFHGGSDRTTSDSVLPESYQFDTSTEYLTHLSLNGWLRVPDYGIFALPGTSPARGKDHLQFKSENNAWCVVVSTGPRLSKNDPFLISRNIACFFPELVDDATPLGTNLFRVITWDGQSKSLLRSAVEEELLRLSEKHARILFP